MTICERLNFIADFATCQECDGAVTSTRAVESAMRKYERTYCCKICRNANLISTFGCCDKAKLAHCGCYISTDCPEHGVRCRGSHD